MAQTVPLKKTFPSPGALLTIIGLALGVQNPAFATGAHGAAGRHFSYPGYDTIHSIQVSKAQTSKKHKIKLYPDARQQVLFFSASGEDGRVYQLFLFDMDGRLVSQTRIRSRETTVLTNISEGNFLFEVFTDDERIENGQLTVR
ncbi:T9SS type A sorting domain-containing protein [Puia dinghuensis]|uniref:T9SS C-terminal target domain-containing protein n=1 Tax=Puia dinghuensis TaxID=1792502 RepID=A0A8J2UEC5_9BACT|nr:T9SS type A sorting domain-containing protein [Puia dinghuensis]GGB04933.1 hypothetical protein GCM10011511_30320 [Puia dinghuensis]